MKKAFLISLLLSNFIGWSQNNSFLLNKGLPIYNNPAFTGTNGNARVVYGFSGQNLSFSTRSLEHYVSYDRHYRDMNGGIGVELYNRNFAKSGVLTTSLAVNYAYQHAISEKVTLSGGAGIYYKRRKTDFSKLLGEGTVIENPVFKANYADYKVGGVIYNDVRYFQANYGRYHYGGSNGTEKFGINYLEFGVGNKITLLNRRDFSVLPSFVYQRLQGEQSVSIQAIFRIADLFAGARYEIGESFSVMTGYTYGPFVAKIAGAINVSKLNTKPRQQIDFIVQFNFSKKTGRTSHGLVLKNNISKTIKRNSNAFKLNLF